MTLNNVSLYKGTVQLLKVSVTSDMEIDLQPVHISFDRTTWLPATWLGAPGLQRTCQVLIDDTNIPAHTAPVYVRVTDTPEIPILKAGFVTII